MILEKYLHLDKDGKSISVTDKLATTSRSCVTIRLLLDVPDEYFMTPVIGAKIVLPPLTREFESSAKVMKSGLVEWINKSDDKIDEEVPF